MVNAVGGTTVHYDAVSPRLLPWNLQPAASRSSATEPARSRAARRSSTGLSATTTSSPYYDVVEKAIGVGGTDGANPFEGSRFSPYPMPPLRRSGWNRLMHDSAQSLGWHPYAAPTALNSEPYNGNPECTYCGFCASNGCYRNAKGSTDVTVIRRAVATARSFGSRPAPA